MRIRRAVFQDKGRCVVEETDLDEKLGENEVLVRNRRSLVSAGTELAMFTKIHRGFTDPTNTYARYPFFPGYSAVGEVVKTNPTAGVGGIKTGDTVAYKGKHSTYSRSGEMAACFKVAPAADEELEVYTFASLLTTALTCLHVAPIRPGENVLVVGLGIVGNLAAQLYRAAGAGVVAGADFSAPRIEIARRTGAVDIAFNLKERPLPEWLPQLGKPGAELVVDAVGLKASIQSCISSVARRGRVVLLGSPREKMEIDPYNDIHSPGVQIIGAHTGVVDTAVRERDRAFVARALGDGRIRVKELITQHMDLDDAPAAYAGLRDKPDEYVGVIFRYPVA
jgi:2-desacetyl-2-hydroxyethyl bacteriochlorophyllide A dehydrogenase